MTLECYDTATRRRCDTLSTERSTVFAELQDALAEVMPTLQEQGITVYLLSDACPIQGVNALAGQISEASDEPMSQDLRANVHIRSTALYIYTSGTTGTEQTKWPCSHFKVVQSKGCCNSTIDHQGASDAGLILHYVSRF